MRNELNLPTNIPVKTSIFPFNSNKQWPLFDIKIVHVQCSFNAWIPGKQIPVTTETRTENLDRTGSLRGIITIGLELNSLISHGRFNQNENVIAYFRMVTFA